ncbi:TolB family protein [Butyrivibrio sp. JL13D10]|uniref:TolB family protein n=1 Tax=Butyrivibrio sp. JL13D10 TaxID=3236815 RepID=UPI0038B48245
MRMIKYPAAAAIVVATFLSISTIAHAHPNLTGKIVYHSYSDYNAGDSRLYLYDFSSDTHKCLSSNWTNVKNPMNACFRKDGKAIVFMGQTENGEWDIFEYTFADKKPINLTMGNDLDDEDPKYDSKGKNVIFKQSNPSGKGTRIVRYNLKSAKQKVLIRGSSIKSMPYYSKNGKKVYYVEGEDNKSSIRVADINKKKTKTLYKKEGTQSYYPIVSNDGKYLFFSRGYSKKNNADQIIRYNLKNDTQKSLKCNSKYYDSSDTCCVSSKYIIISCSKDGGVGGYDLHLVNIKTGKMTSLSQYNSRINTPFEELGCDYYDK